MGGAACRRRPDGYSRKGIWGCAAASLALYGCVAAGCFGVISLKEIAATCLLALFYTAGIGLVIRGGGVSKGAARRFADC